jgi:hypothetical protein
MLSTEIEPVPLRCIARHRQRPWLARALRLATCALIAALTGCGASSAPPAKPAAPLSAHAREVAAVTAWDHGDGDMLYQQLVAAMSAWAAKPDGANAAAWWQMAGISLREPPPVGTAVWKAAVADWEKAAQLAGGDTGAPTGSVAEIERYLRRGDTHMAAATAAIAALRR